MRRSLLFLLVLPLVACDSEVDAGDTPVFKPLAAQPLSGAAATVHDTLELGAQAAVEEPAMSALLYSDLDTEVAPRIDGVVRAVYVELGDAVQAGELLARLDDGREAARVASARAALELARTEHDRALALRDRDLIPRAEYETMQYRLRAAEAALREAEVELGYTRIAAPFSGVVTRRVTGVGRTATEGEPLFRVTALRPLRLLLRLPETQAYAVPVGATVHLAGSNGASAVGRVVRVSPAIDPGSGTAELLVQVPQPGSLRPGSEVAVRLETADDRERR
jgi:RND family efflux transporter MFP subunit